MKLNIYKGFDIEFMQAIEEKPLIEGDISEKIDVLKYDKKTRKALERALLDLGDEDSAWITYQEYTVIKNRVDDAISEDGLIVSILKNNLYPDYYPIEFVISDELAREIDVCLNNSDSEAGGENAQRFLAVYNALVRVDSLLFGSFYNYEYDKADNVTINNYFPSGHIHDGNNETEFNIFLNEDIDTYLRDFSDLATIKPTTIGIQTTGGEASKRILDSLLAYCQEHGIRVERYHEVLDNDIEQEKELIRIAREDIGITGFKEFRELPFYKNPDIDKEVIKISQAKIIRDIIKQAEYSYDDGAVKSFRDIFITAPTGAGKSVMFQIPAVYLAEKYNKLTIVIEPVKALMQDQKDKLQKNGYMRVETFNSDLITQVEKEAVLKRIKDGEVDLLYLSPETLLSYSIETIIGERDIGLLIVDEAHIVTTWGVGFRPDYWYLGGYINRLRNQIRYGRQSERKIYHFPVCAFTATAINGGLDDSVGETIISLYMENPIKYIGYTKRENIHFEITKKSTSKLPKPEYEAAKTVDLSTHLNSWISNKQKTIVYFPYASFAHDAKMGMKGFANITTSDKIGTYTGRNMYEKSVELFNAEKRETFEKFRTGEIPVMYATKAFGMGVDVDDVENIYHYAATGNLCDYVQEVGRAARKSSMTGHAITDFYNNDMTFMKVLFGMSQIRQYQVKKVLEGIYENHRNKNYARSFLISPESFTYIFKGNESSAINQLKTCLLMLEKDFYDKYNFKVLISRPQSVFTKAYVVLDRDHVNNVLNSRYGGSFKFIQKGRFKEKQADGSLLSDHGDVYAIDLKHIWEEYYPNISFPQFKYWYFNKQSAAKDKVEIMPEINDYYAPRQKVTIETNKEYLLCDLRKSILDDFEYIGNLFYEKYRNQFFTLDDFAKLISERYGMTMARMISNSIFDLIDPNSTCVKHRINEATGRTVYSLANGNFKEYMRKSITKSRVVSNFSSIHGDSYSTFMSLSSGDRDSLALKLLSIFGYITYEIVGGEEPEIFIRLNDPNKVKGIVLGSIHYSNNYVTKAKQKHDRDVNILLHFFTKLSSDEDRWNYIEEYFLGYDVLSDSGSGDKIEVVAMRKSVDREHSYTTNAIKKWADMYCFFDESDHVFIKKLEELGLPKPEYLETIIKKSELGDDILMSWPSKNTLICQHETVDSVMRNFATMGWNAYRVSEIDYEKIVKDLS